MKSDKKILSSIVLLFGIFFSIIDGGYSKQFTTCEVTRELQRAGISRTFLSNWVCLMQAVSGLNSELISEPKTAASREYGIFQISSRKYCTRGRLGGSCNIRCENLANDDIQDDIRCAKTIFDSEGFKAWDGWTKSCKNKPLPDVRQCIRRRR